MLAQPSMKFRTKRPLLARIDTSMSCSTSTGVAVLPAPIAWWADLQKSVISPASCAGTFEHHSAAPACFKCMASRFIRAAPSSPRPCTRSRQRMHRLAGKTDVAADRNAALDQKMHVSAITSPLPANHLGPRPAGGTASAKASSFDSDTAEGMSATHIAAAHVRRTPCDRPSASMVTGSVRCLALQTLPSESPTRITSMPQRSSSAAKLACKPVSMAIFCCSCFMRPVPASVIGLLLLDRSWRSKYEVNGG